MTIDEPKDRVVTSEALTPVGPLVGRTVGTLRGARA